MVDPIIFGVLFFQVESFSQWLFKQSIQVVLLVLAIIAVARYFSKQNEKKDALLESANAKHETNLREQITRSEQRIDSNQSKYDVALERRDSINKDTARAVEMVGDRLRDLAEEIRGKRH